MDLILAPFIWLISVAGHIAVVLVALAIYDVVKAPMVASVTYVLRKIPYVQNWVK